jgi:hypothetical protein
MGTKQLYWAGADGPLTVRAQGFLDDRDGRVAVGTGGAERPLLGSPPGPAYARLGSIPVVAKILAPSRLSRWSVHNPQSGGLGVMGLEDE